MADFKKKENQTKLGGGSRSIAACFIKKRLVARGTAAYVADRLGVTVNTLRRYRRKAPPGMKVLISPTVYIASKDGKRVIGPANRLSDVVGSTNKQVCNAAIRGHKCNGWQVTEVRPRSFSLTRDEIMLMRESLLAP